LMPGSRSAPLSALLLDDVTIQFGAGRGPPTGWFPDLHHWPMLFLGAGPARCCCPTAPFHRKSETRWTHRDAPARWPRPCCMIASFFSSEQGCPRASNINNRLVGFGIRQRIRRLCCCLPRKSFVCPTKNKTTPATTGAHTGLPAIKGDDPPEARAAVGLPDHIGPLAKQPRR